MFSASTPFSTPDQPGATGTCRVVQKGETSVNMSGSWSQNGPEQEENTGAGGFSVKAAEVCRPSPAATCRHERLQQKAPELKLFTSGRVHRDLEPSLR